MHDFSRPTDVRLVVVRWRRVSTVVVEAVSVARGAVREGGREGGLFPWLFLGNFP